MLKLAPISGSSDIRIHHYSVEFPRFGNYDGLVGYFGKLDEKLKAQELRRQGLSYGEILQHVNVSKDTLSRWSRDIPLTVSQKKRLLKNKAFGQRKGSLIAADNKRRKRFARIREINSEAKIELGVLNKRDRFIAGITLYAGEGSKRDGDIVFANSDPKLIKFMMSWFMEFSNLPLSKFRGAIWLHEGLDELKSKTFWSDLTGIPITQFHKTYVAVNKRDSKKIRKNIHEFGIFSIRINDREKHRRLIGWISALFDAKISSVR